MAVVLVALGGAAGSVLRYWLGLLVVRVTGPGFPWGTLLINIVGSFIIGFVYTFGIALFPQLAYVILFLPMIVVIAFRPRGLFGRVTLRLLLMVGFCGGFTTFSSFSLQTLELLQQGAWLAAWGNMLGSVALCMGAVTLGWTLGRG